MREEKRAGRREGGKEGEEGYCILFFTSFKTALISSLSPSKAASSILLILFISSLLFLLCLLPLPLISLMLHLNHMHKGLHQLHRRRPYILHITKIGQPYNDNMIIQFACIKRNVSQC